MVGAGPAGLALACGLATLGVGFRIIDQAARPTLESRAALVQVKREPAVLSVRSWL